MKSTRKRSTGFTMVELAVVMVILGVLAAIALPKYIDFTGQANTARAEANADTMRLRFETYVAQQAAINPANVYPTLSALDGLPANGLPSVPSGWSANNAPSATAMPSVVAGPGTSTYPGTPGAPTYGIPGFAAVPPQSSQQGWAQAYCTWAFPAGIFYGYAFPLFPVGAAVYPGNSQGRYIVDCIGPFGGGFYSNGFQTIQSYTCPIGGAASGSTCSVSGSLACPAGYALASGVCSLSNASQVSCPTGYSSQSGGCFVSNPSGILPLALDNSGVCVGPNLKAATWIDAARSAATTATSSNVVQIDAAPAADAINCPSSMFP